MSDDKKQDEREIDVTIGTDSDLNPKIMFFTIPIKALAEKQDGTALLRGTFEELKMMGLNHIKIMRMKKAQASGIIKPGLVS